MILPGQTIGIIGGGQLGRMMALAAKAQGFRVAVLDPIEDSPCGQIADYPIVARYDDMDGIKKLAEVSDVITYEFENIDADALSWLVENSYVPQRKEVLQITQNRISEKEALTNVGATVAPYQVIQSTSDLYEAIQSIGYPSVLKTATGGYDGKGQVVFHSPTDLSQANEIIQQGVCVLEKWIPFEKEISVIVSRNVRGEIAVFPVVENIHRENILHMTIAPARISEQAKNQAIHLAKQIATSMNVVGTLAIEMFLTANEQIYINELAPRPHNTGHFSIEACETSQFEQHIRAVCNWPLGSTGLLKQAVMVNILGEHVDKVIQNIKKYPKWKIHLYGKKEVKKKRKMGHITILTLAMDEALAEIEESQIWK